MFSWQLDVITVLKKYGGVGHRVSREFLHSQEEELLNNKHMRLHGAQVQMNCFMFSISFIYKWTTAILLEKSYSKPVSDSHENTEIPYFAGDAALCQFEDTFHGFWIFKVLILSPITQTCRTGLLKQKLNLKLQRYKQCI